MTILLFILKIVKHCFTCLDGGEERGAELLLCIHLGQARLET